MYVGLNTVHRFGIFEGFVWVRNLVFIDESEFGGIQNLVFQVFGLGFGTFQSKQVRSWGFLEGFELGSKFGLVDKPQFELV